MSSDVLIIRFPDGDAEFSARSLVPTVGDRIWRRNEAWIVAAVDTNHGAATTVTVMPAEVTRDDSWPEPYQSISAI